MPICGFCKNKISFEEGQSNSVKREKIRPKIARYAYFVCLHCNALLSIAGPY